MGTAVKVLLLLFIVCVLCTEKEELKAILQEVQEMKKNLMNHIKVDRSEHKKLFSSHELDHELVQENKRLEERLKMLSEKLSLHEKTDFTHHEQILREDSKDDIYMNKLKETLQQHVLQEETTVFSQILRSLATILTGVGLGALINQDFIPNFVNQLFEYQIFRFLMIVILAWQGGAGFNIMISILGSAIFFVSFGLVKKYFG